MIFINLIYIVVKSLIFFINTLLLYKQFNILGLNYLFGVLYEI